MPSDKGTSQDMFTVSAVSLLTVQLLTDGNYIVPQTSTCQSQNA